MRHAGAEHPSKTPENPSISETGAVKGAVENADSGFAAAVAGIMALPLTIVEKAEAVRRLLASKGASK